LSEVVLELFKTVEGYPQPTIWAFCKVITWYITHRTVSLNHRVELENRLRRAMVHLGN